LRVLIEELDDLHRAQNQLVKRAQSLAEADDNRARIMKVSSGFERFAQVEPAMFEDVLDEELAKYDKFLREIGEIEQKQKGLLSDIQVQTISDTVASQKFMRITESQRVVFAISEGRSFRQRTRTRLTVA
jgi:ALIX V-shaped domain binding to HIV